MTEPYCAAVRIHALPLKTDIADHCDGLGREGFVRLDKVDRAKLEAGPPTAPGIASAG